MEEFSIIDKYFRALSKNCPAACNLEDDVARISLKNDEELIASKDLIVEDIHFLKEHGGAKIATKLLLSNLSDIAASGGKPEYYMIGFGKNDSIDDDFLSEFCGSLKKIQEEFGIYLIGGDTVSCGKKLFFSATVFGTVKKGQILSRKNAKDGDLIFVSGDIGNSYLGLKLTSKIDYDFNDKEKKYFLDRHFYPKPRIELGQELLKNNLSKCATDISDGLLADLRHICKASDLCAEIYKDKIPLASSKVSFRELISGGEDYELIFSCKKNDENKVLELAKKLKIKLTCIGVFKKNLGDSKITLFDEKYCKIKIEKYGYEH